MLSPEVDSAPEERRALPAGRAQDVERHGSPGDGATEAALAALVVEQARDRVISATADYDLILAPVLPVPTFPADHVRPERRRPPSITASFIAWFNQTGQPAASICGGRRLRAACRSVSRSSDNVSAMRTFSALLCCWKRLSTSRSLGPAWLRQTVREDASGSWRCSRMC